MQFLLFNCFPCLGKVKQTSNKKQGCNEWGKWGQTCKVWARSLKNPSKRGRMWVKPQIEKVESWSYLALTSSFTLSLINQTLHPKSIHFSPSLPPVALIVSVPRQLQIFLKKPQVSCSPSYLPYQATFHISIAHLTQGCSTQWLFQMQKPAPPISQACPVPGELLALWIKPELLNLAPKAFLNLVHSYLSRPTPPPSSNTSWLNGLQTCHDVSQLQACSLCPNSSSALTPPPQHPKLSIFSVLLESICPSPLFHFPYYNHQFIHLSLPGQCDLPDGCGLLIFVSSAPMTVPGSKTFVK